MIKVNNYFSNYSKKSSTLTSSGSEKAKFSNINSNILKNL